MPQLIISELKGSVTFLEQIAAFYLSSRRQFNDFSFEKAGLKSSGNSYVKSVQ